MTALLLAAVLTSHTFVTSDGVALHYVEQGRGPAVVLVPGWTMPAEVWEPQLRGLGESHRVIALDPRAQGRSEAPRSGHDPERRARDLRELLDAAAACDAILVGWSLGAADVLSYAEQFGDEGIRGIVIVDAPITQENTARRIEGFARVLAQFQNDRAAYARGFVRNMFAREPDPAYAQTLVRAVERVPADAAVALVMNTMTRDWRAALRAYRGPLLFAITTPLAAQAEVLLREAPQAQVEVFDRSGHALFADEPERFNALLAAFTAAAMR